VKKTIFYIDCLLKHFFSTRKIAYYHHSGACSKLATLGVHDSKSDTLFSESSLVGILEEVPIGRLRQSKNMLRLSLKAENELALSIKSHGLLHPLVVRASGNGTFEIIAGNRRYLACKALRWRKVLCRIVEMDDKESFEVSLIENIQRRTLNPVEEARAFKTYVSKFGWGSESELAGRISKSVSYVNKRMKLLELPPDILASVHNCSISSSMAEELMYIKDPERQSSLADIVKKMHLSTKKARQILKEMEQDDDYDNDDDNNSNNENDKSYDGGYNGYLRKEGNSSNNNSMPCLDDLMAFSSCKGPKEYREERARKSLDRSIITLRIALNKLALIIEGSEDDWLLYEMLMQHKKMLHAQIDLLIKEKKKYAMTINAL
jgi:ParB family chromosome partitioning protein